VIAAFRESSAKKPVAVVAVVLLIGSTLAAVALADGSGPCFDGHPGGACEIFARYPVGVLIAALPLTCLVLARYPVVIPLVLYIGLVPLDATLPLQGFGSVTRLLGIVAAVTGACTIVSRRAQGIAVSPMLLAWVPMIVWLVVSRSWTVSPADTSQGIVTVVSDFALFCLIASIQFREREFEAIVKATILSGGLAGLVAIYLALHARAGSLEGARLFLAANGRVADPNDFAAALLLPFSLTVARLTKVRSPHFVPLIGLAATMLAAIYCTGSRGAFVGLLAMAIVGICLSKRRIAGLAIVTAMCAAVFAIPNSLRARFLTEQASEGGSGRVDIWRVALTSIRSHWLAGSGFGSFPTAYDRALIATPVSEFQRLHRAPHNLILGTLTELGAIGFACLLFALTGQVLYFVAATKNWRAKPDRIAYLAAFVGILVSSLFVDVLTFKYVWLLFMEMAILAALCRRTETVDGRL
jgi:O-antigen ligase